ncbi:MAG: ACP S-malonyltransferase [Trueperaceae bacterium]
MRNVRLAALFPGQGSQKVGMAQDLYAASPAAKRVLDDAEAALPGLLRLMWQGPAEDLQLTANQQPALVAAGAAAYAAWLEAGGPAAEFGAGHSLGEYTAHVAAGSLSVADAVTLVRRRGTYMQEAVPEGQGAMAAVLKLEQAAIDDVLRSVTASGAVVEVANLNSPGQTVISGSAQGVTAAAAALKEQGGRVIPLKVSAPFHCSLMQPAADRLAPDLEAAGFSEPAFAIVCNVTAEPLTAPESAPALLTKQVTASVRWVECVERLAALGATHFVEFGSGNVLTGLVGRILPDAAALAVDSAEALARVLEEVASE